MTTLHLLIGPVGAGKSTFGRQRAVRERALFLDIDTWMVRLFGEDQRPEENVWAWYLERRERCRALMWDLTVELLAAGIDVYLELGLITAAERQEVYARARGCDISFIVYLLDAPRETRRERVSARNEAANEYTQVVPSEIFELASDAWQAPTPAERSDVSLVDVRPAR